MRYTLIVSDKDGALEKIIMDTILIPRKGDTISLRGTDVLVNEVRHVPEFSTKGFATCAEIKIYVKI